MTYKPITENFQERYSQELESGFPRHFHEPITHWLYEYTNPLSKKVDFHAEKYWIEFPHPPNIRDIEAEKYWIEFLRSPNIRDIEIVLRSTLSMTPENFFSKPDLVIETLNVVLQASDGWYYDKAIKEKRVWSLESILYKGGHEYQVGHIGTEQLGLEKRVPDELTIAAEETLNGSKLFREAWHSLYKKDPDPNTTVIKCVDALETKMKKYYPKDSRPLLGKIAEQLLRGDKSGSVNYRSIDYIGKNVDRDIELSTNRELLKELIKICIRFPYHRGEHTGGLGVSATKEDAKFILHTSILLYNII